MKWHVKSIYACLLFRIRASHVSTVQPVWHCNRDISNRQKSSIGNYSYTSTTTTTATWITVQGNAVLCTLHFFLIIVTCVRLFLDLLNAIRVELCKQSTNSNPNFDKKLCAHASVKSTISSGKRIICRYFYKL